MAGAPPVKGRHWRRLSAAWRARRAGGQRRIEGYVNRLMYQKCLAAGGARIDLDGNVAGIDAPERRRGLTKAGRRSQPVGCAVGKRHGLHRS